MSLFTRLFASKEDIPEKPMTGEIGAYGSGIYWASDFSRFNPDELIISKGSGIYSRMAKDDQVKAVSRFKRAAVVSRPYFFDVDEDNPEHEEQAEVFQAVIDNMQGSWRDALMGIMAAMQSGYSISEKVFNTFTYDGREYWGLKKLKLRPFDSFEFEIDKHGNIMRLYQRVNGDRVEMPLQKVIHYVHQPDIDEIYGESDFRACYRDWWSKDIIIKFRNIFLERHASGFVFAKVKPGLNAQQQADLKNMLSNLSAHTAAVIPDLVELDMMNPQDTDAFERAIQACDKAISKSMLVPNLLGLSEQGDTGSYSQSQTQFEAFLWVLDESAVRLEEVLNEQLFRQLSRWNFGTDDFPRFKFVPMSGEQKNALLAIWGDLIQKGAVKRDMVDENHIRRLLDFPEREEEEIEEPTAPPVMPPNPEQTTTDEPTEPTDDEELEQPESEQVVEHKDCGCHTRKDHAENPWLKRVDFAEIDSFQNLQTDALTGELVELYAKVEQSMIDQSARIWGTKSGQFVDPMKVNEVRVPKSLMAKLARSGRKGMEATFKGGIEQAQSELPQTYASKVIKSGMDSLGADRYIAAQSFRMSGDISDAIVKEVQQILANGVKFDWTAAQITQKIQEVTSLSEARAATIARTTISDAYNQSRLAAFQAPELDGFVLGYEYSSILDGATSEVCTCLDGKTAKDFGDRTPPNHFNCRSLLIPITETDEFNGEWSDAASIARCQPQSGFGGG